MTKFTKLMLTLALLLVGVVGAKAEKQYLSFETADYCAASWNAETNTLTWGSGGWNSAWTFMTATGINGDLSSWETLHLNAKSFTNSAAEELTVVFKKNDGSNPPSGPTKEFVVSPDGSGDITIDLTSVDWGDCDITNVQDLTIYGGARTNGEIDASVVITDAYLEKTDPVLPDLPSRAQPAEPAVPQWGTLIKDIDYSTTNNTYPYYRMEPNAETSASFDVVNGQMLISILYPTSNFWYVQPFVIDNVTMREGYDYVVRIKMNTTGAGSARVVLGTWSKDYYKDFDFADAYAYYDIDLGVATFSSTNDVHALLQCGNFFGKIAIDKVEVFEVLPKQGLSDAIDLAKLQPRFAKTSASWNALQEAITAGETALAEANTLASVQDAKDAVEDAIAGLTFLPGYSNLTADKFKHYASLNEPGEGETIGCAYEMFTTSGLPYGDGNVGELNWADLAGYDNLVVLTQGSIKPRFCINRIEADGNQAATQAESKMIDINDNNGNTWSATKYQTIDGNVYTINLQEIVNDWGIARLHSIKKQGWGEGVTVTGMYLYRNMSYGVIGELTGGFDAADIDMTPTATEGEYTLTVNGFKATAGDYNYKLRANDSYGIYDLPDAGNKTWTCPQSGTYNLTFTADVLNHTLTLTTEKVINSMTIVGFTPDTEDVEKWNESNGIAMTQDVNDSNIWTAVIDKYTITKVNESLDYKYKAVANGSYGEFELPTSGNQNYDFTSAGEGLYKLTFTANTSSNTVSLAVEKLPTATIYFINNNDWTTPFAWVWDADNDDYNYTGGKEKWPGQAMTSTGEQIDGKDVYSWSTYDITGTPTNVIFSNNGSSQTGDLDFADGKTYKADGSLKTVAKSVSEAGYATLYSTYALDFTGTGLTAYIAKADGDDNVVFETVTTIPANTGVLLKGAKDDYNISVIPSSTTNVSANIFEGVTEATSKDAGIFVLMDDIRGLGFYKTTTAFTVGANTAYIPSGASARAFIGFGVEGETTAVENLTPAISEGEGAVYDLQGRRVAKPTKGLYIVNGKKVVKK